MSAPYKDPDTLAVIHEWFSTTYPQGAHIPFTMVTEEMLYQSYHEYTTDPDLYRQRLNYPSFVKCLMAASIIDIGGRWEYIPEYKYSEKTILYTKV